MTADLTESSRTPAPAEATRADSPEAESIPAGSAGGYKWLVVFMLWWVCFFNYADRQAIFSVFPTLNENSDSISFNSA